MPLVSQTSYQAIQKLKLVKSDRLLILGGSTATGLIAIQIAKHFIKCKEVIVTSTQHRLCKGLGADRVIDYKAQKWSEILKNEGMDAIYDTVGGQESWDLCRTQNVLKKDGRFATIVGDSLHGEEVSVGTLLGTGLSLVNRKFWGAVGHQKYDFVMADSSSNLRDITALIDGGKIKAVLDAESPFKFSEFMKMFDKSMSHKARGKLVLHIADDDEEERKLEQYSEEEEEEDAEEEHYLAHNNIMADEYNARQSERGNEDDDAKQTLDTVQPTDKGRVVVAEKEEDEEPEVAVVAEVEPPMMRDADEVTGDDIADAQDMADEDGAAHEEQ